ELEVGVYTIKVVVTSTTGYLENFNTVEYIVSSGELTKLDAPQNVTLEGDLLSWDTVDNASGYQVIMNGITQSTNDTSYNLKNFPISGTFDVVVVAVGDQIFYANSDASDALEYEAQAAPPLNPINAGDFVA